MSQGRTAELFFNHVRGRDRVLELLPANEEYLVNVRKKRTLTVSLFLVHTARRSYRFERLCELFGVLTIIREGEVLRAQMFRGRRSRNKASIGEPVDGSLVPTHN